MMDRLQSLFNRLAGTPDQGTGLPSGVQVNFQPQSFSALERPACWRRRCRPLAPRPAPRCK